MTYRLQRDNRKRLSVLIDERGEVIVRAPMSLSQAEIEAFLRSKAGWIEQKSARRKREAARFSRIFSFETCLLFGQCFLPGARMQAFGREILIPSRLTASGLKRFYRDLVEKAAEEFYRPLSDRGLSGVKVRSFRKKWGSCDSRGQICLSFRLAMIPWPLVEYVLIHEACHLKELNHSPRFWAEVEALCPDYRRRRTELKSFSCLSSFL